MILHYNMHLFSNLPKEELVKYEKYLNPNFENILKYQKYATQCIKPSIFNSFQTCIDRSDATEHPLKVTNLYPHIQYDPNFNKSFANICFERAKYLLEQNKTINIYWSGGLDSTTMLFVFLQQRKYKEQIVVYMNYNSILESGYVFETFIKDNFLYKLSTVKTENLFFNKDEIYLTGHPADQISFGSHVNTYFNKNLENLKPDSDFKNHVDENLYNWMKPSIENFSKPIKTVSDFSWFWGFNYRWQNACLCLFHLIRNSNLGKEYREVVRGFYDNDDFQRWSMRGAEIEINNMNSKPYMRNLIYSIGREQISDYVKNKNRNPSTYVNYNRNYLFTDENFKNVYVSDEIVRKVYG